MLDFANELFDDLLDKDKIMKRMKDKPLSTDKSNLFQFTVISRYVVGDTLHEESLEVLTMKGTTRGEDLFKSFTEFAKEKKSTG